MTYRAGFGDGDVNRVVNVNVNLNVNVDVNVDVNVNVNVNGDMWVRSFPANVIPGGASAKTQNPVQSLYELIEAMVNFEHFLSQRHGDTEDSDKTGRSASQDPAALGVGIGIGIDSR